MDSDSNFSIAERIENVRLRIRKAAVRAHRDPEGVKLVAVTKRQPLERVWQAYDAGLRDFGENYVQSLLERRNQLPGDIRWHFIGHLQSNKAKLISWPALVHSVDSAKVARILAQAAHQDNRTVRALVHVNISEEPQKGGVAPNALADLLDEVVPYEGIEFCGLMCIPEPSDEDAFVRLRMLRDEVAPTTPANLTELSMGMSASFERAIAEGATIVRVGTDIFGPRP